METTDTIYVGSAITDLESLERMPEDYQRLLHQMNVGVLFNGGLHVRRAVFTPEWHSLRKVWCGDFALYRLFSALKESDVPFAQDCLGDQFVLRSGEVHRLYAEKGEVERLFNGS